jgi:tetratricopeptide (TPR) repeat protein
MSEGNLGTIAYSRGSYDEAEEHFLRAHDLQREAGDRMNLCISLARLGCISATRGDFQRAFSRARESLAIARDIQALPNVLDALGVLCGIANLAGDHEQAAMLAQEARAAAADGDPKNELVEFRLALHGDPALKAGMLAALEARGGGPSLRSALLLLRATEETEPARAAELLAKARAIRRIEEGVFDLAWLAERNAARQPKPA